MASALGQNGSETCGDVVGFTIRQLPVGYSMIANPFDCADNRIPALFAAAQDGTTLYKWDEVNQAWETTTKFGGAWSSYPLMTLYPGEGLIVDTGSALTVTFFARVRQNCLEKNVSSQLAVHSSQTPVGGILDSGLGFPIANGDTISVMSDTSGNYQNYTYNNGTWSPNAPNIPLGSSFWSSKAAAIKWRQNLSVW